MEENGMYIKRSKVELLKEYEARLQELFGVTAIFVGGDNDESRGPGPGVIPGTETSQPNPGSGHVRVVLARNPGTQVASLEKAKVYITSLLLDDADKCVSWEPFQPAQFRIVAKEVDRIEAQSQAVLSVLHKERVVCIWGTQDRVAVAKDLMEQLLYAAAGRSATESSLNTSVTTQSSLSNPAVVDENPLVIHVDSSGSLVNDNPCSLPKGRLTLSHTLSPGTESNHDSCYDSDSSSVDSRRNSSSQRLEPDWHSDVSRQVSDTLAAEHEDVSPKRSLTRTASLNPAPKDTHQHASQDYDAKVEFAIKLGYTEQQLQEVLQTSGSDVNQNTLLSELIKLGVHDEDDEDDDDNDTEDTDDEVVPGESVFSSQRRRSSVQSLPLSRRGSAASSASTTNLRPIVIDGSNVAMSHGNKEVFSCHGIQLAVEWFYNRGHRDITVFVPQWRKELPRPDSQIIDQEILGELEKQKFLVFTPARRVRGKRVICYDDRYILKLASENDGIVVSNDNYRDLMTENPEYKRVVEQRLLMYSFVSDRFMPPDDPLGRRGPSLDNFLQKEPSNPEPLPPVCPYAKKCTYGNKCKYYHPERGPHHRNVTEKLAEQAKKVKERKALTQTMSMGCMEKKPLSAKPSLSKTRSLASGGKTPLSRTRSLHPMQSQDPKPFSVKIQKDLGIESSLGDFLNSEQIKVSVTDTDSQEESIRTQKYNEKLDKFRKKVEEADKVSEKDKLSVQPGQRLSQSHGDLETTSGAPDADVERTSLKPPGHWAVHDNLRHINSDPSKFSCDHGGGHLSLAKKLSDESAVLQKQKDAQQNSNQNLAAVPMQQSTMQQNVISKKDSNTNLHRKLNRQLSLKGPEDQRLQSYPVGASRTMSHGAHLTEPQANRQVDNRPIVHFGGPQSALPAAPFILADVPRMNGSPCSKHVPVTRMGSAPVYKAGTSSTAVRQPVPTMSRQNSTSDPQLNLIQEDHPQTVGQAGPATKWVFGTAPSESGKVRVAFGPAGSAAVVSQQQAMINPAVPRPQVPTGYYNNNPYMLSRTSSNDILQASTNPNTSLNSPMFRQQYTQASLQHAPIPAFPLAPPPQAYPNQSQAAMFAGQGYNLTSTAQMGGASVDPGGHQAQPVTAIDNTRNQLFYHLCGLFPEDKVRLVMQQHPYETNAPVLCSHIMSLLSTQ